MSAKILEIDSPSGTPFVGDVFSETLTLRGIVCIVIARTKNSNASFFLFFSLFFQKNAVIDGGVEFCNVDLHIAIVLTAQHSL